MSNKKEEVAIENDAPQKPLPVIRNDLVESIVSSINQSGIPVMVVEYILRDILNGVSEAVQQQIDLYEAELRTHQEANEKK